MTRIAGKDLLRRKRRLVLTSLAVSIGVTMMSGTLILSDGITAASNSVGRAAYSSADAIITGRAAFGGSQNAPSFPAWTLARVRALPSVADAAGATVDAASYVRRDGTVQSFGLTSTALAVGINPAARQSGPLTLLHGAWPAGRGEMAIDRTAAAPLHVPVGGTVAVLPNAGHQRRFRVSGVAQFGRSASLGVLVAVFDLPTAQLLFHKPGEPDEIHVTAKRGVSSSALLSQIAVAAPRAGSDWPPAGRAERERDALGALRYPLLPAGVRRDRAVRRRVRDHECADDHRRAAHARVRDAAFPRCDAQAGVRRRAPRGTCDRTSRLGRRARPRPRAGRGPEPAGERPRRRSSRYRTRHRDADGGGLARALHPGHRSRDRSSGDLRHARPRHRCRPRGRGPRPQPVRALRSRARAGRLRHIARPSRRPTFASGSGLGGRLPTLGLGLLGLFIGIAMLAPRLVHPLVSVLAWPQARLGGVAGALARANAMRHPGRTAASAAAVMIPLALMTAVAVLAASIARYTERTFTDEVRADYVLTSPNLAPTSVDSETALARSGIATVVAGIRIGEGRAFGQTTVVTAVDPGISKVLHVGWQAGTDGAWASLGTHGAIVSHDYAHAHHLAVGSPITVQTPSGKYLNLRVQAVPSTTPLLLPRITISSVAFAAVYRNPQNEVAFAVVPHGVSTATTARLQAALRAFPGTKIETGPHFVHTLKQQAAQVVNLIDILLELAVIVSVFGIVNTLVLAVHERTRELGILRAIGLTRRQTRRMIRDEAVVMALIGAALGIPIGIGLAVLLDRVTGGVPFVMPSGTILNVVQLAVTVGLLAAILPARRAARLDVLEALQYE